MRSHLRVRQNCAAEVLEVRSLLTAGVSVSFNGSLLRIIGSDAANHVAIQQSANGNITVSGREGTLINGRPSVTFPNASLQRMEVELRGGDDVLVLGRLNVARYADIYMGAGNDRLITSAANPVTVNEVFDVEAGTGNDQIVLRGVNTRGDLDVDGDAGNDRILLDGVSVRGNADVDGGTGQLVATIRNVTVDQSMDIDGEEAVDRIAIDDVRVGNMLSVDLDGAADVVSVLNSRARNMEIETDETTGFDDRVHVKNMTVSGNALIETGGGNDRVSVHQSSIGRTIRINTGAGNDRISAGAVSAAVDAFFSGGSGFDILLNDGITARGRRDLFGFERR